MGHSSGGMGLDYIRSLLLLPILLWFLLYVLVVKDLFGYLLVFFIDGCSADSCGFGVLVRGGELRVFLLCHLGPNSLWLLLCVYFSIRTLVSMGQTPF